MLSENHNSLRSAQNSLELLPHERLVLYPAAGILSLTAKFLLGMATEITAARCKAWGGTSDPCCYRAVPTAVGTLLT